MGRVLQKIEALATDHMMSGVFEPQEMERDFCSPVAKEKHTMKRQFLRMACVLPILVAQNSFAGVAQNSPEFSLALSPASITLPQGAVTSVGLTFESNETPGYTISLSGLPEGVQAQPSKVRDGMATVVLYASPEAALGTFVVQVTAHAGKSSQTQILTLNVKPLRPSPQWEYSVVTANSDEEFLSYANSLGSEGWELVSVRFREQVAPSFVGFFKRIKR